MISPYLEKPVRSLEQVLSDIGAKCGAAEHGVSSDGRLDREFRENRPDLKETPIG